MNQHQPGQATEQALNAANRALCFVYDHNRKAAIWPCLPEPEDMARIIDAELGLKQLLAEHKLLLAVELQAGKLSESFRIKLPLNSSIVQEELATLRQALAALSQSRTKENQV